MEEQYQSLLALQELDEEIARAEEGLATFATKFADVDAPVATLERESEAARTRLAEMRQEARRLERAAEDKRDKLRKYQERLERVRSAREEAAVRTELDLIRKAADADESDALEMMDQITRSELKLDELEKKLDQARAEVEPRRKELEAERDAATRDLAVLRDRRENLYIRLDPRVARLYDRMQEGTTRVVIAGLMEDGACGHCFGLVPLQQQTEIRQGKALIRCEACGVILYPGS